LEKAVRCFEGALAIDPAYALAYAGLADCYNLPHFGTLSPREAGPRAKAAAMKALQIDEGLAEAHVALAFAKYQFDWDWAGAESGFTRAIELNPNYARAHHAFGRICWCWGVLTRPSPRSDGPRSWTRSRSSSAITSGTSTTTHAGTIWPSSNTA